jgi:hypothetical protein
LVRNERQTGKKKGTRKNGRPLRKTSRDGVAAAKVAAVTFKPEQLFGETSIPSIRIPNAVTESLAAPARRAGFSGEGMTGAQVFANLCKDEDLAAMFCAAGNYYIVNEIAQVGIPSYGGRT